METAEIIARALDLPAQYNDQLCEPCLGPNADGQRWADIRAALSLGANEFPHVRLGGGESWTEYLIRVTAALRAIMGSLDDGRLVVVAHAETVIAAYHLFLGCPPDQPLPMDIAVDHAGLNVWRASDLDGPDGPPARWTLVSHNDTSHLVGRITASARSGERR
jgi:2,3-bisphosphoglycerate-dependent phosphoglycerate mutase